MDKEIIIKNAKNIFKNELLDIVINQINNYYELAESNYIISRKYKVNDRVILNKNHLLHGIGKHKDLIKLFSKRGIISSDFFFFGLIYTMLFVSPQLFGMLKVKLLRIY